MILRLVGFLAYTEVRLPHEHFSVNKLGHLVLDGYDLVELAERFGTPLYVVSEGRLRENYRQLAETFKTHYPEETIIAYAVKANFTLAIIRIFALEGAWAETFTGPEFHMALMAGVKPENILLTGTSRGEADFKEALEAGVGLIVADSLPELYRVSRAAEELGGKARVLIRVNPALEVPTHPSIATGVRGTKFGIDIPSGDAFKAFEEALALEGIIVLGVHTHIGSRIMRVEPFLETARRVVDFIGELNSRLGFKPEYLDLGGGFGIPYRPEEFDEVLDFNLLAKSLSKIIVEEFRRLGLQLPKLVFEPGRSLVADAELLLAKVGNVKETPAGKYIFLDASTNHLTPVLLVDQYFEIILANKVNKKIEETVNFAGPLCFTGDIIALNRRIPKVETGDLAAILSVGAYCKSSYMAHNAQPKPPTVMLSKHGAEIVQRGQTLGDLLAHDVIPPRLYHAFAEPS
ncbi:TPA: diaminopimelate decarboxylase [Candidatus Bathyarchaeota archaeon]|nr:diaminopimelate decarboxylase [Candidatus Bathyarchaeota archaeon]